MTANRLFGIGFLFLAVFMFAISEQIEVPDLMGDPGPLLLPRIVEFLMGGLGIALSFMKGKPVPAIETGPRGGFAVLAMSAAAALLFVILLDMSGFTVATAVYLFLATAILGNRTPKALVSYLIGACVASVVLGFILGSLLELPLPGILI